MMGLVVKKDKIEALYRVSVNGKIKSYTFSELRKDEESNDE